MDWTNFIRTLGHDEPTSLLDPEAYSNEDIEEDLMSIDMDKQKARNKVEQKNEEYEAKLDEAAEAPEWMEEDLLMEADDIEREKEDWKDEWRQHADQKRLVKSVQSFRRRINASDRNLNIHDLQAEQGNEEVRKELRDSLQDHMRSQNQVDELLQMFTNSRDLERSDSGGNSRNLDKHRKRLEARQNGDSSSSNRESNEERSRSANREN